MQRKTDIQKAEQMILYFAHKSKRDAKYGMVKLAKMMFYADFQAFKEFGKSITGLEYKKLPQGPVPTSAKAIHESLIERGLVVERYGSYDRKQLIPTERFNKKSFEAVFTDDELEVMDWVYDTIKGMKAIEVSDLSHEFVGWQVAAMNEVIPYGTTLIERRPLTQKERDYAAQLARELSLGA